MRGHGREVAQILIAAAKLLRERGQILVQFGVFDVLRGAQSADSNVIVAGSWPLRLSGRLRR